MNWTVFVTLALYVGIAASAGVSCIDESGSPVDWWIIYKLPNVKNNAASQGGMGYAFMSSKASSLGITGKNLHTNLRGALANTLYEIYNNTHGYVMWNGHNSESNGHTKGVLAFDVASKTGFLLRHSTPRFPNSRSDGYQGLPTNEHEYGQTYICITTSLSTLNDLAGQYLVANPQVYDSKAPSGTPSNITQFANQDYPHVSTQYFAGASSGGFKFLDIVKGKSCGCDFWDVAAAKLNAGPMEVLSWGRPIEPSNCNGRNPVMNVQTLAWSNGGSVSYKESNEHSKWGITTKDSWICLGDMNRMVSQEKRGGGATCIYNNSIKSQFMKLITGVESCN